MKIREAKIEDINQKSNIYGNIKLVNPTMEYKEQVMNYRKTFLEEKESFDGCAGLEECETYEEWIDFEKRLSKKYQEEYVPSTVFLAIRELDNKLIGMIDFRHELKDFLFNYGGNIGYSVIPSERRKGYAKEMLRLMLDYCKQKGVARVLLACDKENIASKKTIIANGGVLENEVADKVGLSESGTIQRYWISLKKRFADRRKEFSRRIDLEQITKSVNEPNFMGDVYIDWFKKVEKPFYLDNGLCVLDTNYKWIEFYDYSSRVKLTAIYNEKNEIVEWYFDIAREIGKEDGVPYEDDLYLDVLLRPDGEVVLLDEDELKEAFDRREMTQQEYDEAYKVANDLMERLKGKRDEVKAFTDRYLNYIL